MNVESAFQELLRVLIRRVEREWRSLGRQGSLSNVRKMLGERSIEFARKEKENFERFWNAVYEEDEGRINFRHFLVPLPPIEKELHLVPFMYVQARKNKATDTWCCRFYVLLFTTKKHEFRGFGIRFESPESCFSSSDLGSPLGRHDFFHAQLCKEVEIASGTIPLKAPQWLPETQPSFPMKAESALDLFVAALLTLYGMEKLRDLWKDVRSQVQNFVGPRLTVTDSLARGEERS